MVHSMALEGFRGAGGDVEKWNGSRSYWVCIATRMRRRRAIWEYNLSFGRLCISYTFLQKLHEHNRAIHFPTFFQHLTIQINTQPNSKSSPIDVTLHSPSNGNVLGLATLSIRFESIPHAPQIPLYHKDRSFIGKVRRACDFQAPSGRNSQRAMYWSLREVQNARQLSGVPFKREWNSLFNYHSYFLIEEDYFEQFIYDLVIGSSFLLICIDCHRSGAFRFRWNGGLGWTVALSLFELIA